MIYIDPADNEEKATLIKAPNERLAMRAVFSSEIVSVMEVDEGEVPRNLSEDTWSLY